MKVLAITSALLIAFSGAAAAVASPAESFNDGISAREASPEAAPMPGWWGFRWSGHGTSGWKRSADAAPEPVPGWWGFRWSNHGTSGWKRDATPEPVPGWWGFRWSNHGTSGWKRDVSATKAGANPADDADFIYLPKGMTPDDLAAMLKDAEKEKAQEEKDTKA